jgi:hypothetical protein
LGSTLVDAGNVSNVADADKQFTNKCVTTYKPHPKFSYSPQGGDYQFEIKHYAGNVTYTTKEWIEKNKVFYISFYIILFYNIVMIKTLYIYSF